jgi:hypothetical protein
MFWIILAALALTFFKPLSALDWTRAGINLGALAAGFVIPAAIVLLTRKELATGANPRRVGAVLILGALAWLVALFATYRLVARELGF